MELKAIKLVIPEGANVIFGQSHFIKTVEDLCEILVTSVPGGRFGLAFCEASGPCLIRHEGNEPGLEEAAVENARALGCGHTFVLFLLGAYPINVLAAIKACQEVCSIFCATANPVEVIVAETEQGRGVLGVIDGSPPLGVEQGPDREKRREFLRRIGYKL